MPFAVLPALRNPGLIRFRHHREQAPGLLIGVPSNASGVALNDPRQRNAAYIRNGEPPPAPQLLQLLVQGGMRT